MSFRTFSFSKCLFLLSLSVSILWIVPWTTDFPSLSFLLSCFKLNDLLANPLSCSWPRTWHRTPRWDWCCIRGCRLACHISERTRTVSWFWFCWCWCLNRLCWRRSCFDVDRLDEASIPPVTMCVFVILDPVVAISFAQSCDLACKGPLFGSRILKPDLLTWSEKWEFAPFWQIVFVALSVVDFQTTFFDLVSILWS